MPSIINDVDSLKKFRNRMLDTVDDLLDQLKKTEGSIETVSQSWKDSQFEKFKDGFAEDVDTINPLCERIREYESDVLKPLEDTLRDYLKL